MYIIELFTFYHLKEYYVRILLL